MPPGGKGGQSSGIGRPVKDWSTAAAIAAAVGRPAGVTEGGV